MPSFLGGKSPSSFGQPAFFLAGNRMTVVGFEKEVFFKKAYVYLAKRLFDSTVILNLRKKHLISINGKKKLKRILVEGEKFNLKELPSKDFIALFVSRRRACPILKHNRESENGFKVHDFEYYGQRNFILKWKFNLCH